MKWHLKGNKKMDKDIADVLTHTLQYDISNIYTCQGRI